MMSVILSESYDILGGYAGYMNLGHGAFWGIGAYSFALIFLKSFSIPLSMLASGLIAAFFAFIFAFPLFRLRGAQFAITGFAIVLLLQYTFTNLRDITGGSSGISIPLVATLVPAYYTMLLICVATITINFLISKSKLGLALSCIKEDEDVAKVLGIDTFNVKLKAFVMGGFLAGLSGGAYMYYLTYIYPTTVFSLENSVAPVVMALLGGSGVWYGPIAGSIILTLIQEFLWTRFAYFHLFLYGLLMLIVGLFMPSGIIRSQIFHRIYMIFKHGQISRGSKNECIAYC
jgi:branched-chain amino acid transport system permease protein